MHFKHFQKDLISIHVWRQCETQTTIDNFYEEDFNILNPRQNKRGNGDGIFRMEFPLIQWLIAGTYKIFGQKLIITRIIMFLTGLFTIAGIYELVKNIFTRKLPALIAAWTFSFSPVFYYYNINPIPDNFALCCSVWGLGFFFGWIRKGSVSHLIWSGVFLSLGTLSKLPFILYYTVPAMFFLQLIIRKQWNAKYLIDVLLVGLPLLMPLVWYLWVIPQWSGNPIVKGIFGAETSLNTILDYLQHNLISTMPELLLGYGSFLFFIAGIWYIFRNKANQKNLFVVLLFCGIFILIYFIYEITAIAKIHDYYLFPFLPFLFILVGYGADNMIRSRASLIKYISYSIIIAVPFICHLRMQGRWNSDDPGFNKDLLDYKQELRDAVPENALCIVGNDESSRIFLYYIHKKGWVLNCNNVCSPDFKEMIDKGAEYLYSDSRSLDEDPRIKPHLNALVSEHGSIKVFSLVDEY